ncbi:MAG: DUF2384 domain-containing protein [Gammaproteobacteria bacterium]|nr:MAG: DUF2384 domain-containing protein [Gammaproteobacteria bacterium]
MTDIDDETRLRLARGVMNIFEQWNIALDDQVALLGLPDGTRKRSLHRYKENTPLPDDPKVMERVEHLIGIDDALGTYFPNSLMARKRWLHTHHRQFTKKTPLQAMVNDGVSGLIRVRAHLDCTYAWDLTGSKG